MVNRTPYLLDKIRTEGYNFVICDKNVLQQAGYFAPAEKRGGGGQRGVSRVPVVASIPVVPWQEARPPPVAGGCQLVPTFSL